MKKLHYTANYIINPYHRVSVYLIGCGGNGSQVLTSLARINIALQELGHPGLYVVAFDSDIVTEANLGRQLFSVNDLGLNKANVLVTRINRFFGTDWDAVADEYPNSPTPDGYTANITITCVDSVKARVEIGEFLRKNGQEGDQTSPYYWLDFGNTTDTGQAVLGTIFTRKQPKNKNVKTVEKLKCVDELFDLSKVKEEDSGPSCSLAAALRKQDLFINSTLANLGCNLIWKLISQGCVEQNGLYLNLKTMKVNPINL